MGEGAEQWCQEQNTCPFLLEGKGQLFGIGYEEVESRVVCMGGATSCRAADGDKKQACGPNKKNVCIPVWKHKTKIVVVDCSAV